MSKEAMKLALEALEGSTDKTISIRAMKALREALASEAKEQPAQQQELEHDEHGPECSHEEFLLRGILASELKCWHRLTEDEAQNLVAFVQNMPPKPAQQEPVATLYGSLPVYDKPAQQDIPDLIAGALGVSRGTAYDMMREALAEQPAQQEPLTDEEIEAMANDFEEGYVFLYRSFARAIEAAHGITKGGAV